MGIWQSYTAGFALVKRRHFSRLPIRPRAPENAHAQALSVDGTPVPSLHVDGNDMRSLMGGQYPAPGITLGPALTFAWPAGQHLAHTPPVESQP